MRFGCYGIIFGATKQTTTMKHHVIAYAMLALTSLSLVGCKKEPKLDECGNEIPEEGYGGLSLERGNAYGIVLIMADDVHELDEPITIWNADNGQQSHVITHTTARGTEGGTCSTSPYTPANYPHYSIPRGTTYNWRARNASGTFDRSGSLRNPDCQEGEACYFALLDE